MGGRGDAWTPVNFDLSCWTVTNVLYCDSWLFVYEAVNKNDVFFPTWPHPVHLFPVNKDQSAVICHSGDFLFLRTAMNTSCHDNNFRLFVGSASSMSPGVFLITTLWHHKVVQSRVAALAVADGSFLRQVIADWLGCWLVVADVGSLFQTFVSFGRW